MTTTATTTGPARRPFPARRPWQKIKERLSRIQLVALIGALIALLVVGGGAGVLVVSSQPAPSRVVTAEFAAAPGLYVGNHVDVLGLPVGQITRISPGPTSVTITMKVKRSVRLPADVQAFLDAPQVVNDRDIELTPVYEKGPVLPAGAVIPLARTSEPLTVDEVLKDLNDLFAALGPSVTNNKGVLGDLINQLDSQLNGEGQPINTTINQLGTASGDLAADAPKLNATLKSLSSFVTTLAADSANYESFTSNLAGAATELNGDRSQLATALSTLGTALGTVASFVQANGSTVSSTITSLNQLASAIASKQQALAQALQITPLTLQNITNTVGVDSENGPTHNVVEARADIQPTSTALLERLCGDQLIRVDHLVTDETATGSDDSVWDPICIFGGAAGALHPAPGVPSTPDLSLTAIYAAEQP